MSSIYDKVSEFRSDMPVEAQLIQKVNELQDRIESLDKRIADMRKQHEFDIENIVRQISSTPSKSKANWNEWDELKREAKTINPYTLFRCATV